MDPKIRNIGLGIAVGVGLYFLFRPKTARADDKKLASGKEPAKDAKAKSITSFGDKAIGLDAAFVAAYGPTSTYTVKSGDTLSKLADMLYGDEALWGFLFDINRTTTFLADPNSLKVGDVLIISEKAPAAALYAARHGALKAWYSAGQKGMLPAEAVAFTAIALK